MRRALGFAVLMTAVTVAAGAFLNRDMAGWQIGVTFALAFVMDLLQPPEH